MNYLKTLVDLYRLKKQEKLSVRQMGSSRIKSFGSSCMPHGIILYQRIEGLPVQADWEGQPCNVCRNR